MRLQILEDEKDTIDNQQYNRYHGEHPLHQVQEAPHTQV
jgi:hypothetical protein